MRPSASIGKTLALLGAGAAMLGLSACASVDGGDDLVAGKEAFVEKCGSCHVLTRAGTTGTTGPNLDQAFTRSLKDGMKRSTIKGVVHRQIEQPAPRAQMDAFDSSKPGAAMPADLVTGELARDVAAYVAYATARKGEDTGRLAELTVKKATEAAQAENGTLDIPANPDGLLAYLFASATAPPGPLTINSKNDASIPHNIALEGGGIDELGEVVQDGGTSTIEVDVKAGEYTFYCSVPGHREGGMEGTLTVK